MKEISELNLPEDVRYAEDHEWVRSAGDKSVVGISDYAQDQLGDIVFVELPEVGATLSKGEAFGTVESVKAVSELYMPVGGEDPGHQRRAGGIPGAGQQRALRAGMDDRAATRRSSGNRWIVDPTSIP